MLSDLRFAFRRLRHTPGFTAIAVLTIAVAVGANTAILSIADAVLFRPLPYREPDRVFLVQMRDPVSGRLFTNVSLDYVRVIDASHQGLSRAGTFSGLGASLENETAAGIEFVPAMNTSASYFDILGVRPALGRLFTEADLADRERPLILSYGSWQTRFGGDRAIIGRRVTFGARTFDVIGVLPRDLVLPSITSFTGKPEVFLLQAPLTADQRGGTLHPIFRLEPGVTRDQAQAEINALIAPLLKSGQQAVPWLLDIRETIYPTGRAIMRFLLAAAMLVLLLGSANLANMMLARGRSAERQTAVRIALGAGRLRVMRPVLFEALIVGALGSALAIAIDAMAFDSLATLVPSVAYGNAPIGLSARVGAMALALGLTASAVFAMFPAWRLSRLDVQTLVQQRGGLGRRRARLGRPMVATQVALAIVLIFGAVVAARAFVSILRTPLGFTPDRVLTVDVSLPRNTADLGAFYTSVRDAVRTQPGIEAAGAVGSVPMSSGAAPWTAAVRPGGEASRIGVVQVLSGYFESAGISVIKGRSLDDASTTEDLVISASAARTLFGETDPIGQPLTDGRETTWRIVGVVNDVRSSLSADGAALAYAFPGSRVGMLTIVARASARTGTIDQDVAAAVRAVAPRSRVTVAWWADAIGNTTAYKNPRFQTGVLGMFAGIALGLTALGIFAVVSFLVASRTRELGIRLAIGASPRSLVGLTMRQMFWPVAAGLVVGLLATRLLAKLAEAQLFKVDTRDPATLAIASAVVMLTAMLAAYLPARRAERIDPIVALRTE